MREKLKRDIQQSKFGSEGKIEKPNISVGREKIDLRTMVYCPFCLYRNRLSKFLMSGDKGISNYKAKCPECQQTMLFRTIANMCHMNEKKIEAYAKWVADYAKQGFWKKCKYEIWKERLQKYDMAIPFWRGYKKYRTTIARPDIED